ncbi:glycosyl transferase family 1 [Variovorax paradoxus]|uniref:Glycosyl transferase family 1 n=1 Tax=Variovorax paradoxus TaxID=34073 RepID=A0A0D0MFW8_VARPD|nr:MSMEG_0565 family glycosyltransferase [Variovorax paradoxus]KIQ31216.1 glycosyl transferase family 1 [Variovorax paradoxus]
MSEFDRPLRIGLLTHSVNPRGGVVHTLELATALHAAGHAVTVMAPAAAGQAMFRTPPCRVELALVNDKPRDTVGMVRSRIGAFVGHLHALLQRETFDVLHTQDSIGGNALAQLQDEGRIGGFVRTVHHLDTFDDPQLTRWQQNAFERASLVLSASRLWCDHLRSDYGIEAHEIDNGVDTQRFSPVAQAGDAAVGQRLGIATGAPVVLAIGGVEERKNTARLLAGFALLRARHPRAQLVIAGGASLLDHAAYTEAFRAQMQALGFDEGPWQPLRVTGPLPDADIAALYRLADVVAMPSLREGFGLVVLEGLASGVPVVASRIAPFTEHLAETDVSWADPQDPASIAGALDHAIATRDAQRIAASSARLSQRFSWAASAARHVALYRAHLKEKHPCP